MFNLPYDTLGDLAAALIEKHFPGYFSLPYNRYNLGQSQHWWLSPTPDKVAFPYGKAIFSVDPGWFAEGNVFCGFNVEKGLTSEMAEPKNCIMDENWFWHRFVELSAEPLAGRIEEASDAIGQPLQLLVSAGTFMPDDVWSRVSFGIANALLADTLKSDCDVKGDNLSLSFPTSSSLETVSELISGIESEDMRPIPNTDAMENLKFSECLSPEIAAEVFTSRFDDRAGVVQAIGERRRVVVEN